MNLLKLVLAALCLSALSAHADDHQFGAGFILGSPTALSVRDNLSSERAFDVQLAFDSGHFMLVYGDYLFQFHGLLGSSNKFVDELTPYVGVGAVAAIATRHDHDKDAYFDNRDDRMALAARIPFGVEWLWDKAPIGVGLELAPGIVVIPSTDGFIHAGVTLRYYF